LSKPDQPTYTFDRLRLRLPECLTHFEHTLFNTARFVMQSHRTIGMTMSAESETTEQRLLGRSKKMNPYLTALKPLRKRQYLGNQLFAAALLHLEQYEVLQKSDNRRLFCPIQRQERGTRRPALATMSQNSLGQGRGTAVARPSCR
jgi:hypothetical protein